jgi:copper chaperone CopZ
MSKVLDLKIEGMTCGHCEASVTKELQKLAGATDIVVQASNGTAHLVVDEQVTTADISAAIDEAGYKLISN